MLVLTRKCQEKIQIGDNITITIVRVKGQSVRVGIEAPRELKVKRSELPPEGADDDAKVSAGKAPVGAVEQGAETGSAASEGQRPLKFRAEKSPLRQFVPRNRTLAAQCMGT